MGVDTNPHYHTNMNSIFSQFAAAKNSVRPSEGVAGGGGWGEESRHARAKSERGRTRRPARQSRAKQNILFLLEEKIRRAQIRKSEECFAWRQALASGGGEASFVRIGLVKSSDFVQETQNEISKRFFK